MVRINGILAVLLWAASASAGLHDFWPQGQVPPLDPELMAAVKDSEPIGTITKNEPEAEAYCDALRKAWTTPAEAFARVARLDLTYAQLFEEPARYRGQVIHIEGKLVQLSRFDAPLTVQEIGAQYLYEGWVFDHRFKNNPWCVLCTRLPAGIDVGKGLDVPVKFDGYFFKRYRYKSADAIKPGQGREVPLLIGPTMVLQVPPSRGETAAVGSLSGLPFLLTVMAAVLAIVFGLAWWYRRGDRRVRERLASHRLQFVEPTAQPAGTNGHFTEPAEGIDCAEDNDFSHPGR